MVGSALPESHQCERIVIVKDRGEPPKKVMPSRQIHKSRSEFGEERMDWKDLGVKWVG